MTNRTLTLVVLASVLAACDRHGDLAPSAAHVGDVPPMLAHATQADLARELDEADRRGTWTDVKKRWQGQTLRWTVTRYSALCHDEGTCHIAPFPVQRPAKHGWMPALHFAAGEFRKVVDGCGTREPCELQIEGKLSVLEVSADLPTSLHFSDVKVVHAGTT